MESSSQLSPVGLCGIGFGSGCSFSQVGPASLLGLLCFLCFFHHIFDYNPEVGSPFPALGLSSPNLPQSPRAGLCPSVPWVTVGVQNSPCLPLPITLLKRDLSSSSPFPAWVSQDGNSVRWVL